MSKITQITMIITIVSYILFILAYFIVYKVVKMKERIERSIASLIFSILMLFSMMFFSLLSLYISERFSVISSLLNAVFLIASWRLTQKLVEKISIDDCLSSVDKQWITLFSLIAVAFSGVVFFIKEDSTDYLIVTSVAISIMIGAYVPITSVIENNSINDIWNEIKKPFVSKSSSLLSKVLGFLCLVSMLILMFTMKAGLIDDIGVGVVLGTLVFLIPFILIIVIIVTQKKRKDTLSNREKDNTV